MLLSCVIIKVGGNFGYLFSFGSGAGKREEASEQVTGGSVFIENRGRGGGLSEEAGWGFRRHEDVCRDGELIFFFGGPKLRPRKRA